MKISYDPRKDILSEHIDCMDADDGPDYGWALMYADTQSNKFHLKAGVIHSLIWKFFYNRYVTKFPLMNKNNLSERVWAWYEKDYPEEMGKSDDLDLG